METRAIITVSKFGDISYKIACDDFRDRKSGILRGTYASTSDPAMAAAEAMGCVNRLGGNRGYVIFAPAAVLKFITEDMRQRP
jgi:hypothetical protein